MQPREMYQQISPVRRIVDAYAAVVPWGDLRWRCPGQEPIPIAVDDISAVVRALILNGRANAQVTIGNQSLDVAFEHRELGGLFSGESLLAPLAGNADSYVKLSAAVGRVQGLAQYLALLIQTFEMQLSLPGWVLDQRVVAGADVVALKWVLLRFRFACDRYRTDIAMGIRDAFGRDCDVEWQELQDGNGLTEYAPLYRAFLHGVGVDLVPLKAEAVGAMEMLANAGILGQSDVAAVAAKFA